MFDDSVGQLFSTADGGSLWWIEVVRSKGSRYEVGLECVPDIGYVLEEVGVVRERWLPTAR